MLLFSTFKSNIAPLTPITSPLLPPKRKSCFLRSKKFVLHLTENSFYFQIRPNLADKTCKILGRGDAFSCTSALGLDIVRGISFTPPPKPFLNPYRFSEIEHSLRVNNQGLVRNAPPPLLGAYRSS